MIQTILKKTATVICFTAFFSAIPRPSVSTESPYLVPVGQDAYFRNYGYTGTRYLHLLSNGTYRRIDREHMGAWEIDKGTWSQERDGGITLVSAEHCRDIEFGPLSMCTWREDQRCRIGPLMGKIRKLLTRDPAPFFTRQRIENLEKYGDNKDMERISVEYDMETIQRIDLEGFLSSMQVFLDDSQKNRFHLASLTYGGTTFLLWKDSETSINRDLARIRQAIDEVKSGEPPAFVYLMIDSETFARESGRPQEFLFYPEMNKSVQKNNP